MYQLTELEGLKITELKEIANSLHIVPVGNKSKKVTWIEAILAFNSTQELPASETTELAPSLIEIAPPEIDTKSEIAPAISQNPLVLALVIILCPLICFGLAKRPEAKKLHRVVTEILLRVDVLPWHHELAQDYGNLRAELESGGKQPGPVDILTAAHALQVGAVFITSDRAFQYVASLVVEDWGA